jgi:hypothetical protein
VAAGFLHVGTAVYLLLLLLLLVLLVLLLQPQTKTIATASQNSVVLSLFMKHTAGAMVPVPGEGHNQRGTGLYRAAGGLLMISESSHIHK